MRPVLITGAGGTLGRAFATICERRGLALHATSRQELDLSHEREIARFLDQLDPWLVVNAAGYVRVDDAEDDHVRCLLDNAHAPALLAAACAARAIRLVTFSSDLVFDGQKGAPYHEDDHPAPLGVYGRSKAEAERRVLDAHPNALVVRTSAFFGPWDAYNFVTTSLRAMREGHAVHAPASVVSPTYVPDLVDATLDLAIDGERGIWHLANRGAVRWRELAQEIAARAGVDAEIVEVTEHRAPRPRFSALGSARGELLPPLDDALTRYFTEVRCATRS